MLCMLFYQVSGVTRFSLRQIAGVFVLARNALLGLMVGPWQPSFKICPPNVDPLSFLLNNLLKGMFQNYLSLRSRRAHEAGLTTTRMS